MERAATKIKFGTANYYRTRRVEVDALGLASLKPTEIRSMKQKSTTFNTS
jgi:hypothetical protein